MITLEDWRKRNQQIFEKQLRDALQVALSDQVAIVTVPPQLSQRYVISLLAHMVQPEFLSVMRATSDGLHFEGMKGSVRIYHADNVEYDRQQKRLRGYPPTVKTFVHPELDE